MFDVRKWWHRFWVRALAVLAACLGLSGCLFGDPIGSAPGSGLYVDSAGNPIVLIRPCDSTQIVEVMGGTGTFGGKNRKFIARAVGVISGDTDFSLNQIDRRRWSIKGSTGFSLNDGMWYSVSGPDSRLTAGSHLVPPPGYVAYTLADDSEAVSSKQEFEKQILDWRKKCR